MIIVNYQINYYAIRAKNLHESNITIYINQLKWKLL